MSQALLIIPTIDERPVALSTQANARKQEVLKLAEKIKPKNFELSGNLEKS